MTWLRRAHLTALAGGAFAMAVIFTAAPANASCAFPAKTSAYHFTGTVTAVENAGRTATVRTDDGRTVIVRGTIALTV